jgi:hypothetical protein
VIAFIEKKKGKKVELERRKDDGRLEITPQMARLEILFVNQKIFKHHF